jgi:hypothetical protein
MSGITWAQPKPFLCSLRDAEPLPQPSAKANVRHVAESVGLIPERWHVLVEIHQLAERLHGLISAR